MDYNIRDLANGAQAMARSVFGKKSEYQLQFNHEEDGLWYIDYPNWPFSHHNLLMVAGADDLCAFLSDDDKVTRVSVIPSKERAEHEGYFELEQLESGLTTGSTYQVNHLDGFDRNIWICPVTLFVLGTYPKYIYVKKM
jgi:hypothetical protein